MSENAAPARVKADLTGIPETLLWNVYHRALAARGTHPLLRDPKAIELVERIDYPFSRFGGDPTGQWHSLRVLRFDTEIRRFIADHPRAVVVALGEGLETQFWRVDNGQIRWLSVDLPEAVALRRQLLPDEPRLRTLACSATDPRWMDEVDPGQGVLVSAQGLLMYLQPGDVDRLVRLAARRFPGQALLFDGVPSWVAARARARRQRRPGYHLPGCAWNVDTAERRRLARLPGIAEFREFRPARGRGPFFGVLLPVLRQIPVLRTCLPENPVFLARLSPGETAAPR